MPKHGQAKAPDLDDDSASNQEAAADDAHSGATVPAAAGGVEPTSTNPRSTATGGTVDDPMQKILDAFNQRFDEMKNARQEESDRMEKQRQEIRNELNKLHQRLENMEKQRQEDLKNMRKENVERHADICKRLSSIEEAQKQDRERERMLELVYALTATFTKMAALHEKAKRDEHNQARGINNSNDDNEGDLALCAQRKASTTTTSQSSKPSLDLSAPQERAAPPRTSFEGDVVIDLHSCNDDEMKSRCEFLQPPPLRCRTNTHIIPKNLCDKLKDLIPGLPRQLGPTFTPNIVRMLDGLKQAFDAFEWAPVPKVCNGGVIWEVRVLTRDRQTQVQLYQPSADLDIQDRIVTVTLEEYLNHSVLCAECWAKIRNLKELSPRCVPPTINLWALNGARLEFTGSPSVHCLVILSLYASWMQGELQPVLRSVVEALPYLKVSPESLLDWLNPHAVVPLRAPCSLPTTNEPPVLQWVKDQQRRSSVVPR